MRYLRASRSTFGLLWTIAVLGSVHGAGTTGCTAPVGPSDGGANDGGAADSSGHSTMTTVASSSVGSGEPGGTPPGPPPSALPGDGGAPKTFAITHMFIGTTDRMNIESALAWRQYGFDIDGVDTTTNFSVHCKPDAGSSPADTFPDGDFGRDNSFGKAVLPVLKSAAMGVDIQGSLNARIEAGDTSWLFDLADLGPLSDYDPISAFYVAAESKNGNTWLMRPESLNGTTVDSAKQAFPASYLNQNTWVSGPGTIAIDLPLAGFTLPLVIRNAVVAMDLDSTHTTVTNGTIAGVLSTEEFVNTIQSIAGQFDASLCSGPTVDSILNRIRQASDIGAGGQQDPSKTCDGISIGLGFEATSVDLGAVGDPAEMIPDPCAN